MTDKELRELDAWIAEHVMGWHKVETSENHSLCSVCGNGFGARHKHYVEGFHTSKSGSVPFFTTDPAAAMQVLQKCIEKSNISGFFNVKTKTFQILPLSMKGADGKSDSLPLAICLFAKQLFSKP